MPSRSYIFTSNVKYGQEIRRHQSDKSRIWWIEGWFCSNFVSWQIVMFIFHCNHVALIINDTIKGWNRSSLTCGASGQKTAQQMIYMVSLWHLSNFHHYITLFIKKILWTIEMLSSHWYFEIPVNMFFFLLIDWSKIVCAMQQPLDSKKQTP